jgi:hypothetical protein
MSRPHLTVARTAHGLSHGNTLVAPIVRIRFQICPGTQANTGVAGLHYQISQNDRLIRSGDTDPNGELTIPVDLIDAGNLILRVLETDYTFEFYHLRPLATLSGAAMRLDQLGYVQGIHINRPPLDASDVAVPTTSHHVAVNRFCADHTELPIRRRPPSGFRPKLEEEVRA